MKIIKPNWVSDEALSYILRQVKAFNDGDYAFCIDKNHEYYSVFRWYRTLEISMEAYEELINLGLTSEEASVVLPPGIDIERKYHD